MTLIHLIARVGPRQLIMSITQSLLNLSQKQNELKSMVTWVFGNAEMTSSTCYGSTIRFDLYRA